MQESPVSQKSSATVLDVTELKEPDNILAVLKRAGELPRGTILEFQIGSNPFQLYDLLQQRGFVLEMQRQADGSFLGRAKARDTKSAPH